MSGFMKTARKNSARALSGRFPSRQSKVSAFFLPLPVYLPFTGLLSLLFTIYRPQRRPKSSLK